MKRLDVQCRVDKTNFQFSLPIFKSLTPISLYRMVSTAFFIERLGGSEGQYRKREVIFSDDILTIVEIGLAQITLHHIEQEKRTIKSNCNCSTDSTEASLYITNLNNIRQKRVL